MADPARVGTGSTFTYGTSSYAAEITGINLSGVSVSVIDISHMGTTGARDKAFGQLYEPGQVQMDLNWDPDLEPPYATVTAETGTLAFPLLTGDSTPASVAATGRIIDFGVVVPLEDKMTASVIFQFAGDHTWANGSA